MADDDGLTTRTRAEQLTQLADLHRQGVLSDSDYEAAVARVVGAGSHSPEPQPTEAESLTGAGQNPDLADTVAAQPEVPSKVENPAAKTHRARGPLLTAMVLGALVVVGVGAFAIRAQQSKDAAAQGAETAPLDVAGSWEQHQPGGLVVIWNFASDGTYTTELPQYGATGTTSGVWDCFIKSDYRITDTSGRYPACLVNTDPDYRELSNLIVYDGVNWYWESNDGLTTFPMNRQ